MRLFFLDDQGGSLAALAAGIAILEGAPGFGEVHARCLGSPLPSPLVVAALDEVGLKLAPAVRTFAPGEVAPGDRVIALGPAPLAGAQDHWPAALPPTDAPPLVQRSATRILRDSLARQLRQG